MSRLFWWAVVHLATFAASVPAFAHGEVHPRIEALSREFEVRPGDAHLAKERGLLFALDEDWASATRDFAYAYALSANEPDVEHHLGNALLHLGAPADAREFLDAAVVRNPKHADSWLLRARANLALEDLDSALSDFDTSLALTGAPSPETFLERANAIVSLAPERTDDALDGLEEGMRRLGPLVTLVTRTVELSRGERALRAIDRLPSGLNSTYRWRAIRASVLAAEDRNEEAAGAYREALVTLDALPEGRRQAPATVRDRAEIALALESLPRASNEQPHMYDPRDRSWLWMAIVACGGGLVFAAWRARSR